MKKIAIAAALLLISATAALAQSGCSTIIYGAVLTAGQWNACFAAKQNTLNFTPLNTAGGIMTGPLITAASTTTVAGFNIPAGSPPTSPNNGDMWTTTAGLYVRINGVTVGPLASTTSTIAQEINLNSAALQSKQTGTILQMGQANGVIARAELDSYAAAAHWTGVRADGTAASPTTLQAADAIVSFNSFGYNGTAFAGPTGAVRIFADQNWTNAAQGTYVDIATTPDGSTTLTQVAKFGSSGGVQFGSPTGGDEGAGTLNTAGKIYQNGSALTLAGALTTTGAFAETFAFSGAQTYTFPNTTDTVVTLAAAQTLTNKTLTTPTINGAAFSGTISGTPAYSGSNFITLGNIVQDATAWSFLGNPTTGTANYAPFTIGSLTNKASIAAGDYIMIADSAASFGWKYVLASTLGGGSTVGSINTATGTVVINGCFGSGSSVTCPQGVAGDSRNMKIVQGTSTTLTINFDEVLTETALGATIYKESSGSHTLTITGTGANGMDTGSTPNGYICVYSITKGDNSTFAVLGQNAATNSCPTIYGGSNMPSGYVASGLIGIWPSTSGPTVVAGTILGREFSYTAPCLVSSSITGGTSLTNQSISGCVPPRALTASGLWGTASVHLDVGAVASNTSGTGAQTAQLGASSGTQSTLGGIVSTGAYMLFRLVPLTTAQQISVLDHSASANDLLYDTGFTF